VQTTRTDLNATIKVHSVLRKCAHLSIVYVTYTIDKCAHMRETERIFYNLSCSFCATWASWRLRSFRFVFSQRCVVLRILWRF